MMLRSICRPILKPVLRSALLSDDAPTPAYNLNFMGVLPAGLTYTNSSTTRTYFGSDGLLKTVAANEPIFEYASGSPLGMRWEMEQRTNLALWNRDLTNAAWVSTNGTALKNQAGLDGVANSASSFTATAGNATCLQSITSASAARVTSFFLKRITGTGTVNITQDNGTTWTAVTLTSAWQRFQVTATAANPIIGIRVVTSGDAVALDFAQHETPATVASSPIATTTASVIRQPDALTASSISWYRQDEGTVVFEGIASAITAANQGLFVFSNGSTSERVYTRYSTAGNPTLLVVNGGVAKAGVSTVVAPAGSVFRHAGSYKINNFNAATNGILGTPDTSGDVALGINALAFGYERTDAATAPFMGYARRFQYYRNAFPGPQLQGLSRV